MTDRKKLEDIIGKIVNTCEMPKRNLICALGSVILIVLPSIVSAIVYQVSPADIPSGLPSQIQGKYRIIEHDRSRSLWYVYDVQKWKKYVDKEFLEEGIKMYPPIHQYLFIANSWQHETINKPIVTMFMNELATIIERGKPLKQPPVEGKQLSAKEAKAIVMKEFYPVNKQLWSFKSLAHKNGILVCGFTQLFPNAIGIWWAKGNKVYNVNGIARSKTKNFELTFDPNINVLEVYEKCKSCK